MNPSYNEPGVDDKVEGSTSATAAVREVEGGYHLNQRAGGKPADRALDLLEHAHHINIDDVDPAVLKRLVRKIDLVLMPVMCFCEFFQFLDKSSISYSALFGMKTATHLEGQEYAWLGSIFYFGYLFWQPAASWLLVRVPVRLHLACAVIVWGTVLGCMAAAKNFAGLAALRFLLGMAESAMIPILGSITGMFYTRDEQATRVGLWFGSVGLSQIIGGLIAYGMYNLGGDIAWRFIFILLGPVTVLFGVYIACVIPVSPATAWFLSPDERLLALERIRRNKTGTSATEYKVSQLIEALKDPRMYLAAVSVFCASVQNGGVSSFGSTIIASFGFSTKQNTLVGMTTGGSEIVAMATGVILSRWWKMRALPAILCISVAVMGAALMVGAKTRAAQFAGYALIFWCPVGQMMFIPWMQSMVAGHTKRATFWALYQIGYSSGNIVGAQIYRTKDAPKYIPAKIAILVTITLHGITMGAIALIHKYWNRENAAKRETEPVSEEQNIEFKDRTDKEIPSFVYPY